jgi:fatty acid desaturase
MRPPVEHTAVAMPLPLLGEAGDYRELKAEIDRAGLLKRRPCYYSQKIGLTITGFFLGWTAFYFVGNSWLTVAIAVLLAVLSTQVVFLGHDAGHRQISGSRRVNRAVGLFAGNTLTGLSFGWWVPKHNAHHAYPNQTGRDPDLGGGVIAFSAAEDASPGTKATLRTRGRFQRYFFLFLLLLQGLGLHVTSVQSVMRRRDRSAAADGLLLAVNAGLYLLCVLWVLSPLKALVFIVVHQCLFGFYLGSTFAPNHKGMRVIEHNAALPFLERQVTTARNVAGGWFTTLLYGGLNRQIEHHLFPSMPRPNLPRAQLIVQGFCIERGIPYRQAGFFASYRQAFLID